LRRPFIEAAKQSPRGRRWSERRSRAIPRRRSTRGLRAARASARRARHHTIRMGDMNVHLMAALRAFADARAGYQFRSGAWRLELNHLTQGRFSFFASVL
jgi:hypothetical protein